MRRPRAHAVVGRQRAAHRARYARYMASGRWFARRDRWVAEETDTAGAVVCAVCGDPWDDLHHMTYARMGSERHDDLVPLCREHHDALHRAYEAGKWRGMQYEGVMRRLLEMMQKGTKT